MGGRVCEELLFGGREVDWVCTIFNNQIPVTTSWCLFKM